MFDNGTATITAGCTKINQPRDRISHRFIRHRPTCLRHLGHGIAPRCGAWRMRGTVRKFGYRARPSGLSRTPRAGRIVSAINQKMSALLVIGAAEESTISDCVERLVAHVRRFACPCGLVAGPSASLRAVRMPVTGPERGEASGYCPLAVRVPASGGYGDRGPRRALDRHDGRVRRRSRVVCLPASAFVPGGARRARMAMQGRFLPVSVRFAAMC